MMRGGTSGTRLFAVRSWSELFQLETSFFANIVPNLWAELRPPLVDKTARLSSLLEVFGAHLRLRREKGDDRK
jgi:hypothetical protein